MLAYSTQNRHPSPRTGGITMMKLTDNHTVDPAMIGRFNLSEDRLFIYSRNDQLIAMIDQQDADIAEIHHRLNAKLLRD